MRERRTQAEQISLAVLVLPNIVTKEIKLNSRDYSAVNILRSFVVNLELNAA